VSPRKRIPSRIAGVAIREIGLITGGGKVLLRNKKGVKRELPLQGWEHFKNGPDHVGAGL
jgi:hypothetical protein